MTKAIIVGDGPAGLSAALFLAKHGIDTTVFGLDKTAMHWAYLYNYLGIPAISGSDFQAVSREQVRNFGAKLIEKTVTAVAASEAGFTVGTEDGAVYSAVYVLLAEGKARKLALAMGLEETNEGIAVDAEFRTAVDGLYVIGRGTRTGRSQAIISAGQGATAAIDIISTLEGADFRDFDEPVKDQA